ncbi:UNVERIFIED_CONTAM: hypothetical protein NCL1_21218 [Trichonephila clavipes]
MIIWGDMKFRLFKTPLSWQEAHAACRAEEAYLAMPKTWNDHETLIALMKKGNILQSWIGIRKREGIFYYDNGAINFETPAKQKKLFNSNKKQV